MIGRYFSVRGLLLLVLSGGDRSSGCICVARMSRTLVAWLLLFIMWTAIADVSTHSHQDFKSETECRQICGQNSVYYCWTSEDRTGHYNCSMQTWFIVLFVILCIVGLVVVPALFIGMYCCGAFACLSCVMPKPSYADGQRRRRRLRRVALPVYDKKQHVPKDQPVLGALTPTDYKVRMQSPPQPSMSSPLSRSPIPTSDSHKSDQYSGSLDHYAPRFKQKQQPFYNNAI
jgi:hypothetical protein